MQEFPLLQHDEVESNRYAVSIGSDRGADNWCHNNTVVNSLITGTTTGSGIFLSDLEFCIRQWWIQNSI